MIYLVQNFANLFWGERTDSMSRELVFAFAVPTYGGGFCLFNITRQ